MYGVMSTSLRFSEPDFGWDTMKKIFYQPYFNFHGELFLDEFDSEFDKPCNRTLLGDNPCPETTIFAFVIFIIFLLFCNVLLLSLLIARFSYSIGKMWENFEATHTFLLFESVQEYSFKSILFPPFSIVTVLLEICFKRLKKNPLKPYENSYEYTELRDFENSEKIRLINEKNIDDKQS